VLVLRDIEDLDTAEVAVGLGITANAVKIRLHRARQALRTLVEEDPRAGAPADHRIASQTVTGPRDRQSAPAA
jgi:hypothetical protein